MNYISQQISCVQSEVRLNDQEQNQITNNNNLIDSISYFYTVLLRDCNSQLNKVKMEQTDLQNFNLIFGKLESCSKNLEEQLKIFHNQLKDVQKSNTYEPVTDLDKYGYDMIIQMKSVFDLQNNTVLQSHNIDQEEQTQTLNGESERSEEQKSQVVQQFNHQQKQRGLQVKHFNDKHKEYCKDQTIVGMQGQRNKGKTFLLNSLIDSKFPSDYNVSTPGICLKFHNFKNKNIVYIDSEGLSCPIEIDYDNNQYYKKLKEKLENDGVLDQDLEKQLQNDITNKHLDQKVTEQLQQGFIIQSSDILLIVVSNITQDDQKLIHTISQQLGGVNKPKEVYIVHNLKETHRKQYVEDYIQKLKLLYPLRELPINTYKHQNQNNIVFVDCINDNFNHLVMAYSNSYAGSYYNQFTLYYLKQRIAMCKEVINFNTIEKLKDYFNQNLENFVVLKKVEGKQFQEIEKSFLKYDEQNNAIILQQYYKIEKVKELSVNVFGYLQKDYLYSIYNKEDSRILIVEIPGQLKISKNVFRKKLGVIEISISPDKQSEMNYGTVYASTRKIEEKSWNIRICREGELWIFHKDQIEDLKNGLYKFIFSKDEDEQSG
ncbi:hypothetical protein ABPG72_004549 [Tetrahymena utriculariae]